MTMAGTNVEPVIGHGDCNMEFKGENNQVLKSSPIRPSVQQIEDPEIDFTIFKKQDLLQPILEHPLLDLKQNIKKHTSVLGRRTSTSLTSPYGGTTSAFAVRRSLERLF